MTTEETLYFVQPHVLERLLSGKFIAKRRRKRDYQLRDQYAISPLNVTRRAIRYEPCVFANRKELVIQAVNALNSGQKKLILVCGPSGRGKSSYVRGVVEMMGGGKEQLLWFDVSRHTDFDEVIRFLVDFMTYICKELGHATMVPEQATPIQTLELLLRQSQDIPFLLVIDNFEFLVTPNQTIRSQELKEAFNFLLSFPNVKMIMCGKNLPYTDMAAAVPLIFDVKLKPLSMEESMAVVKENLRREELRELDLTDLVRPFGGEPYLLHLFARMFERQPDMDFWQDLLAKGPPEEMLLDFLYMHLNDEEHRILLALSLIRHGVSPLGLQSIVEYCEATVLRFDFKQLDKSYIRMVLKKVYPPQLVLSRLRNRLQLGDEVEQDPIEAYYRLADVFIPIVVRRADPDLVAVYHQRLQHFYLAEKSKHFLDRVYQARTRHLVAEAQYHGSKVRKARPGIAGAATAGDGVFASGTNTMLPMVGPDMPKSDESGEDKWPELKPEEEELLEAEPVAEEAEETYSKEDQEAWMKDDDGFDRALESMQQPNRPTYPTKPGYAAGPPAQPKAQPRPQVQFEVEPTYQQKQTLRLTEDDLSRLADLIVQRGQQMSQQELQAHVSEMMGQDPPPAAAPAKPVESPPPPPEPVAEVTEEPVVTAEMQMLALLKDEFGPSCSDQEESLMEQLATVKLIQDQTLESDLLFKLGHGRLEAGKTESAEQCLLKALQVAMAAGGIPIQAQVLGLLGHVYRVKFRHNDAIKQLRQLEQLYEQDPTLDDRLMSQAWYDIGEVLAYRERMDQALFYYNKALSKMHQDDSLKGEVLFRRGLVEDECGLVPQAIEHYRQSYLISQRLGNNEGCAATLYNLGSLLWDQGRLVEARQTLEDCLRYDQQIGNSEDIYRTQMMLSDLAQQQGQSPAAKIYAQEALNAANDSKDQTNLAAAYMRLGELSEEEGALKTAIQFFQKASEVAPRDLSQDSRQKIEHKLRSIQEKLA